MTLFFAFDKFQPLYGMTHTQHMSDNTRQQIFVYLFFLVFLDVFGVADADFGVSFRVVSTVSKIFATN